MTIAIGVNFGGYVLLAADTRVSHYNMNDQLIDYDDDHEKIYHTSIGIITGAGGVELLGLVNNKFTQLHEIGSTDLLLDIAYRERTRYRGLFRQFPKQYVEKTIEKTGWIFSYLTHAEGTFDGGTPALRLGMIHPSQNIIGRRHLADNFPIAIYPFEAGEEDANDIFHSLKDLIKPIEQFKEIEDSIQYHGLQIAQLIQNISPSFPSISSYCQVGAHTLDGRTGTSAVVKPGDTKVSIHLTAR